VSTARDVTPIVIIAKQGGPLVVLDQNGVLERAVLGQKRHKRVVPDNTSHILYHILNDVLQQHLKDHV